MKKNELTKNTPEAFVELIREGIDKWKQAGECLVAMLEKNPNIKKKLLDDYPFLSAGILAKLEDVGRGHLMPQLLLSDSSAFRKARELPVSEQKKAIESKVPLVFERNGSYDVLEVDFKSLSHDQSMQVFDRDHIRTEQEQRLFIEQKRSASKKPAKDWEIEGGMIVFRRGARFTVADLSRILGEVAQSSHDKAV